MTTAPRKGDTAWVVDQQGATFAFRAESSAVEFFEAESRDGAVDLCRFTVTVPEDGMTWEQVADWACSNGPHRRRSTPDYPHPSVCHPGCIEYSPDVRLVVNSDQRLIVECDYCGTVVGSFTEAERTIAERIATEHSGYHR